MFGLGVRGIRKIRKQRIGEKRGRDKDGEKKEVAER